MALTRAQYLSGNTLNGVVLAGQPQGVKPGGAGILISSDGTISVDANTLTGVVKLNNASAYNAYVWPTTAATAPTLLALDGAGNLSWSVASIAAGGTGATTANDATNNLLPSQSGQAGKFLSSDGTNTSWADAATGGLQSVDDISSSFNGATVDFVLTVSGGQPMPSTATTGQLIVAIGGIFQTPTTAFTYDSATSTLQFTSAPAAGLSFAGYVWG